MIEEIHDKLASYIDGGVCMFHFDGDFFEEAEFCSAEFFNKNEMQIALMFDNHFFTCHSCGWTMPIDCMGEDSEFGEFQCTDCE